MSALIVVLVATDVVALSALAWLLLRPPAWLRPDPQAAAALDRAPHPPVPAGVTRRLITIEILNPIELAGTRGRLASLAGTVAPGLTRRVVYDQTLRIVREQLLEQQVHADVRVHTLRPAPDNLSAATVDEVRVIDLEDPNDPRP